MTHYRINSDGSISTSYNSHWHEASWTINTTARYSKLFREEKDFPEDNEKLDDFLKTFAKE